MNDKEKYEEINHPKHYISGKYEHADVALDWRLGGLLYAATKHWCRGGKKPGHEYLKDLEKSLWYLKREIKFLKETGDTFGLARPIEDTTIDYREVIMDWKLSISVAAALRCVVTANSEYDWDILNNAVIYLEEEIVSLSEQARTSNDKT